MNDGYIKFVRDQPKEKTDTWAVRTKDQDNLLGMIGWFGRWHGYAFFPHMDMVFEQKCLRQIADFIEAANRSHRERLQLKKR